MADVGFDMLSVGHLNQILMRILGGIAYLPPDHKTLFSPRTPWPVCHHLCPAVTEK